MLVIGLLEACLKLTAAGVAGQYVGPWFVGSVCEASSERRVPSGISGSHVREMCFCCWLRAF